MERLIKIYKAIGDQSRLRIIKMLEVRPLCVCEITELLDLAISTVSKHLSILRKSGLITSKKDGKWVNYMLETESSKSDIKYYLEILKNEANNCEQIKNDREYLLNSDKEQICTLYENKIKTKHNLEFINEQSFK